MSVLSAADVRLQLDQVRYPGFRHSVIRYGLVQEVRVDGGDVTVVVHVPSARPEIEKAVRQAIAAALTSLPGARSVRVVTPEPPAHDHGHDHDHAHDHGHGHEHGHGGQPAGATPGPETIPGVGAVLAVSSCKGGVGKSTVAVNLALGLREAGFRVGLLDADVYGPSVPLMMGVQERPHTAAGKVYPIERHGLRLMSMGFFLDDKSPVIWRGPMVMGLIRQFLRDVAWGDLDVVVVDMPPGTGDAALTLAQQVPITGAIVVTTPQEVALADVERGIGMFRQVQVPVLGIVENMSGYVCPDCGEHEEIFGAGGGEELARRFGVELLEKIPLVPDVREAGDAGLPILLRSPEHPVSRSFAKLGRVVGETLANAVSQASGRPA